ncbi:MAG: BspA family leucine-rich repeat surface protein, partial [Muribaculaceae bacterium]
MANPDTGYFTKKSQYDAYAVEEGDVLTFYYDKKMASSTGTVYEIKPMYDPSNPIPAWAGTNDQVNDRITKVVFDSSFANYQPKRLSSWFKNLTALSTIEGMEYLNTEKVTAMNNIFDGCQSLNAIDLSHFDTSNVTDMSYLFNGCSNLNNIDLSTFDTSNVTDMSSLFNGCSNLNNIDLSTFDTSNVTNMESMFQGCSSLTVLDVSKFDVSKLTITIYMFSNCTNLRTIFCDNTWSADYSYDMFVGCTSLVGVVSFSEMRKGIEMANPDWGYFTALSENPEGREPYVLEENGTITFYYDKLRNERTGTTHTIILNASDLRAYPTWSGTPLTPKETITKAVFDESFKNYKPRYTSFWLCGLSKLNTIEGTEYLNTSKVYDMAFMFCGCESLEEIDLSHFDTRNASRMSYLFRGCTGLTSLDLSSFDTSNAIDLDYMFQSCSFTSLDVTGFNTSNVTYMRGMFSGCSQLQSLNLSSFDTSNVTNMGGLFSGCSSLSNIDISSFDTSNVTNMILLFDGCSSLSNIDLSNFDTKEVTSMWGMFYGCSSLTKLDLTGFNTDKVTDMSNMFCNCYNITTIYCYDSWTCEKSESMFYECNALQGAVGYDSKKIDVKMANPDTGYFTGLSVAYGQVYNKVVTFYYDSKGKARQGISYMVQDDGLEAQWTDATKAVFDESFKNVQLTNLSNFFFSCKKLETVEGLDNLNTENVTNMSHMFAGCEVLTSLDLSGLNTENVTNMSYMLFNCPLLESLDLTDFNTENVTDMTCMFSYCQSLPSLDLTGFNTEKVTSMECMFEWCNALTSLNLSNFITEKVTNMSRMFRYCVKLESLDVTSFNTQNVTNMSYMFDDCTALTSLDLTGFNTEKVTSMNYMFSYCKALTTIYCNDTWTCDNSTDMFTGCTSLVGAVAYNRNAIDVSMANPETGYFTKGGASSVSQINADADVPVEVFNLNGVKIADSIEGLDAGIYIVRQGKT